LDSTRRVTATREFRKHALEKWEAVGGKEGQRAPSTGANAAQVIKNTFR